MTTFQKRLKCIPLQEFADCFRSVLAIIPPDHDAEIQHLIFLFLGRAQEFLESATVNSFLINHRGAAKYT